MKYRAIFVVRHYIRGREHIFTEIHFAKGKVKKAPDIWGKN